MDHTDYSVMYVDDEAGNLVVFKKNFEKDFNVITTSSPMEAIKIFEQKEIAVLIADQKMEEMTGVELLKFARENYPDMIRMMITAYSELEIAINAINLGHVHHYILKPWRAGDLRVIIQSNLQLYEKNLLLKQMQSRLLNTSNSAILGTVALGFTHQLNTPISFLKNASKKFRQLFEKYKSLVTNGCGTNDLDTEELEEFGYYSKQHYEVVSNLEMSLKNFVNMYRSNGSEIKRVILRDLIETVCNLLSTEIRLRGKVIIECSTDVVISVDAVKVGQILLNVILNAVQSLDLTRRENNRVIVRAYIEGGKIKINVVDNGAGIAEENLDKIFQPFFTTKRESGMSAGIGLTITKQLIDYLGGSIELESKVGIGTSCNITLPIYNPPDT